MVKKFIKVFFTTLAIFYAIVITVIVIFAMSLYNKLEKMDREDKAWSQEMREQFEGEIHMEE